jgi:hypothetical protein
MEQTAMKDDATGVRTATNGIGYERHGQAPRKDVYLH